MRTLYDITFERDDVIAYAILSVGIILFHPFNRWKLSNIILEVPCKF